MNQCLQADIEIYIHEFPITQGTPRSQVHSGKKDRPARMGNIGNLPYSDQDRSKIIQLTAGISA